VTADARLAILARVRQAQTRAHLPEPKAGLPGRIGPSQSPPAVLRARFCEELHLLGVETFVEASAADVRRRLEGLIAGKTVLSWDPEFLPFGADGPLSRAQAVFGRDPRDRQAAADIGLTGCEAALAETGTLALISGPGRPRTASLLPMTHIALVREEDLLFGMGEFFERYRQSPLLPYLVFITGPSRTADIELSLTLGVHGPGKVAVIIGP
jgi:L-lactate dehydrogenase complex protein LldG